MFTVGIPTFQRRPHVCALARSLVAHDVQTLVVDDGSDDGTSEALAEIRGVRLIQNPSNLGYAKTLLRLFAETTSPYLVLMSDDDVALTDNLDGLENHLRITAPAFVSTQFVRNGVLFRGTTSCDPIRPEEYRSASAHAPGLVFRTEVVQPLIEQLSERLDRGCTASLMYPQVIVLCHLLADGAPCIWWDQPIASDGALLPSGIRDGTDPYTALSSRWRQEQAFVDFFREQVASAGSTERRRWMTMLQVHEQRLFTVLRQAIELERPDLAVPFESGAAAFALSQRAESSTLTLRPAHLAARLLRSLNRRAAALRDRSGPRPTSR